MNNSLNSSSLTTNTDPCTWTVGTTSNALDWADVSTTSRATNSLSTSGSSILGQTTPSIGWGSAGCTTGYITVQDNLGPLITYLKESEIENMLDILIERAVDDTNTTKQIISSVIRSRHFSEDFILKYFDYVGLSDIRCHHASEINSQNYERLALLIEANRD